MEFRAWLVMKNYSPSTIHNYGDYMRLFGRHLEKKGITDLRKVSHSMIVEYQERLSRQPIKKASQALRIRAVKRLFEFLMERNVILLNPCEGIVETPRGWRLPQPVLTEKEINKLLKAPNTGTKNGVRDRALLELLYSTGMRIGELERLTVYDVDLDNNLVHIRRGKGGRGRVVPLGKEAAFWMKEYIEKVRPWYQRLNPHERALFLVVGGRPLIQTNIRPTLRKYRNKARIKKHLSCHTFRHTCATHLLQQGADITSIQRLLGHVNLSSTLIYTRVIPKEIKETHKKTHPREKW